MATTSRPLTTVPWKTALTLSPFSDL